VPAADHDHLEHRAGSPVVMVHGTMAVVLGECEFLNGVEMPGVADTRYLLM
jgi:hypothetical protein